MQRKRKGTNVDRTEDISRIKQQVKKRPKRRKADMRRLLVAAVIFVISLSGFVIIKHNDRCSILKSRRICGN